MTWLREIDRWFLANVLPHEAAYLSRARRLTSDVDPARDLVQEAYARILTAENWRSIGNPRSYVLRIVSNLGIEQIRRARIVTIQQIANLNALDYPDSAPDPYAVAAGRSDLRHVRAAIDRLPPHCRQVIIMRKFEDMTPHEIAARLDLSLSTVEKRIARGLTLLMNEVSFHQEVSVEGPSFDISVAVQP